MTEIYLLVKNFISTARERLVILAFFFIALIFFKVLPPAFLFLLMPSLCVHGVQIYLANKSYQAHFSGKQKFENFLEILDAISLAIFILALFSAFTLMVFL